MSSARDSGNGSALSADVIVVGAGPAGSATAYYLATAGIDVALLDRATFPRDKVCGDGLTPSAVAELVLMGIDTSKWARNLGLHVIGGGNDLYFPWPEQVSFPGYGLARQRELLDDDLLSHARTAGARVYTGHHVFEAITNNTGRVIGVKARVKHSDSTEEIDFHGRLVVDAGGVSARLATSLGIEKNPKLPMGVAARAYFRSPRGNEPWMESHLELWSGQPGNSQILPGYGWIFPLGDGIVNVGLGSVSSHARATKLPYKKVFSQWTANLPPELELTAENQISPLKSAALPMAFNRKPQYRNGLAIVGDAAGMVSPFNGEGIAPALKGGRFLAQAALQALSRPSDHGFDQAMKAYPQALASEYGGYYALGRIFVKLIENPRVMHACTYYGLPRPKLMKLVNKLLSDGFERNGGDFDDRFIAACTKVAKTVSNH